MDNNIISSHIVVLHGLSGAGKSVLQKALEDEITKAHMQPMYLSSGDCFRALAELDPELAKKMSQGSFIQTLEGTMPLLKKTVNKFLEDLEKSEKKPVLILDGFLRIGEFEYEGKIIPSQIDQVGSAFPLENAGEEVIKKAWHSYVDVNDTDAEALMRIRSEKHLGAIIKICKNEKLKDLLQKAFEIQSDEKYRLKSVPENLHNDLDRKMMEIITSIFELAQMEYKEGVSVTKPLQQLLGEKVTLRDDDLTFKRRFSRINEFNIKTKKGVLIDELKFKHDGENILVNQTGRLKVIENGPSRGISLNELETKCSQVAKEITKGLKVS